MVVGLVYTAFYDRMLGVQIPCQSGTPIDPSNPGGIIDCSIAQFDFYSMYSSSLNNIYNYPGSPVTYGSVIESFGDNFENGGVEHQFTLYSDAPAYQLVGDGIFMNTPYTNYA